MQIFMPTRVFIEDDVLVNHQDAFAKYKNIMVLSSSSVCQKTGILEQLEAIFKKHHINYLYNNSVKANPKIDASIEVGKLAHQFNCDCIVAVGGGSVMDESKIAAIVASNPQIDETGLYNLSWQNKPIDTIFIGTTAGTGSEVTRVAVMTNSKGQKQSIIHDDCYGKLVLSDPKYTAYMNYDLTLATAIDALAHASESYFNKKADLVSQSYSIQCINKLFPYLNRMLNKSVQLSLEDRKEIYICSILGGLAINSTGTIFPHNFGYYLTERFNIPHGIACGYYLNELINFESKNNKTNVISFFERINIQQNDFLNIIDQLLPQIDVKISQEELDTILPRWTNNKNNAINNTQGNMSVNDIKDILQRKLVK